MCHHYDIVNLDGRGALCAGRRISPLFCFGAAVVGGSGLPDACRARRAILGAWASPNSFFYDERSYLKKVGFFFNRPPRH